MERNFVAPLPPITENDIRAAILAVDYSELGDGCTTIATAVLDNHFVVNGTHSFARAKHFSAREGQQLALADVHARVHSLLLFRQLDRATQHNVHRDPSSRTRGSDPAEPFNPPGPMPEGLIAHSVQDHYQYFLAYTGLTHTAELRLAYFHGANTDPDAPPEPATAAGPAAETFNPDPLPSAPYHAEFNPDVTPVDVEPTAEYHESRDLSANGEESAHEQP